MNNSKEPFIIVKGILLGILGVFIGILLMFILGIFLDYKGAEDTIILLTILFLFPCETYIITSLCLLESEDRNRENNKQ